MDKIMLTIYHKNNPSIYKSKRSYYKKKIFSSHSNTYVYTRGNGFLLNI